MSRSSTRSIRRAAAGRGREHDHRPVGRAELLGERVDLRPRLERALSGCCRRGLSTPALADSSQGSSKRQPGSGPGAAPGSPQAMPLRERRPPSADLVGSQLDDAPVMNARVAFASRRSFAIVRGAASCCAVLLDKLAQRDLRGPPVAPVKLLEGDLQRLQRLALTREPAHLAPCRATTVDAIAVRPQWLAIHASRLQRAPVPAA